MAIITIISEAKCKHCKCIKMYNPLKKNGEKSKLKRHKCTHPEKVRNYDISKQDKVCSLWHEDLFQSW
jgi:hypothetical protein